MAYKKETVTLEEAKQKIQDYECALVYYMSDMYFGSVQEIGEICWEECIEARFYSSQEELHLFRDGDVLTGVRICDQGEEDVLVRTYRVNKKWDNCYGKTVQVKEYLDVDEDGQIYVSATRLTTVGGE